MNTRGEKIPRKTQKGLKIIGPDGDFTTQTPKNLIPNPMVTFKQSESAAGEIRSGTCCFLTGMDEIVRRCRFFGPNSVRTNG